MSLRGVRFRYREVSALDGIDLDIQAGERLAILGQNGAGKSTMLRILAGTLAPDTGLVLLDGANLAAMKGAERARRLAFVPQETRVAFDFTVLEIVLMGRSPRLGLLGMEGKRDLEVARQALVFTDAEHLAERPLSHLSSGERQRVILARALAQEPDTILLDEPTAFLDLGQQVRIHHLLESLNRERGMTVVFVSHDLNLAARHAARIVLLSEGRIVRCGTPDEVLTPDAIRLAYGVEVHVLSDPSTTGPTVLVLGSSTAGPDVGPARRARQDSVTRGDEPS